MDDIANADRLREILADLLKRRLADSLEHVEQALATWRGGDMSVFEAHGEVLRHVGRAEMVAEQISRPDVDAPGLLRTAYDSGIVGREEFVELVGRAPEEVEPAAAPPEGSDLGSGLPPKIQVVEELIGKGPILVHIDARADEVCVPESFTADPRLVLRFGYDLSPPIADLEIDDDALSGTLTFGGVPFTCVLPWSAVYAVVSEADQKGMVWPDDVPSAVLDDMSAPTDKEERNAHVESPASRPDPDTAKRGSHLKLVK